MSDRKVCFYESAEVTERLKAKERRERVVHTTKAQRDALLERAARGLGTLAAVNVSMEGGVREADVALLREVFADVDRAVEALREMACKVIDHGYEADEIRGDMDGMGFVECVWCLEADQQRDERWMLQGEEASMSSNPEGPMCAACAEAALNDAVGQGNGEEDL
jgi:hypothetical protein